MAIPGATIPAISDPMRIRVRMGRTTFWKRARCHPVRVKAMLTSTMERMDTKRAVVAVGSMDHSTLKGTSARNARKKGFSCRATSHASLARQSTSPRLSTSRPSLTARATGSADASLEASTTVCASSPPLLK